MQLDPSLLLGGITAVATSVVGWLLVRAVRGVDEKLSTIAHKVDALSEKDTLIQVELADLRARVVHLEYLVLGASRRAVSGEVPKP